MHSTRSRPSVVVVYSILSDTLRNQRKTLVDKNVPDFTASPSHANQWQVHSVSGSFMQHFRYICCHVSARNRPIVLLSTYRSRHAAMKVSTSCTAIVSMLPCFHHHLQLFTLARHEGAIVASIVRLCPKNSTYVILIVQGSRRGAIMIAMASCRVD